MRKTDNLECYRVFCAVAASGGVKEAGVQLAMEPSNIFRLLRQLEDDLSAPLFERQSRPIRLTEQGRLFFDYAQRILREQSLMLEAIRDNLESDTGFIQIASTAGVRHQTLTPALVQYQEMNPGIALELRDMVQGARNFFVAPDGSANDIIVTFQPEDPVPDDVHVEKLIDLPFIACASPVYLARHGVPLSPEECHSHRGLLLRLPGRHSVTHLAKDGRFERLAWQSFSTYNSQLDAIEALVLGAGICPDLGLSYFIEQYHKKRLVPVLPGWSCPPRTVCLFASSHAYKKKRVREFLKWFGNRYRAYLADCLSEWRHISSQQISNGA